ncbi:MAG: zinc ribbon domain-containing protein [Chloracidobacterium sp.]|nr:zinc ribbon domain-containing protein [Chloracidobacterium sp.]MDW8217750.1 hypothetical protein [Acidobacteriota bacterium]
MSAEAPSGYNSPYADSRTVICPNCDARLSPQWKFCIRCGLRYDPAAFARLAALDAERRAILTQLLPSHKRNALPPTPNPAQPTDIAPAAELKTADAKPPSAPPQPPFQPNRETAADLRVSTTWLLKTMVYSGGLLMVVGALIYLRQVILEHPTLQLGLLTAFTVGVSVLGVRGVGRRPDDLVARGGLWVGALLLPATLWLGVHHGRLPAGGRWVYGLTCGLAYWLAAVRLNDPLLPHMAVPSLLLAAMWLGLDLFSTPAVAVSSVAAAAVGCAFWSALHPAHIIAIASWWWGGAAVTLCALCSLVLSQAWVGGVVGVACFSLGCLVVAPAAVWGWSVGGLGLLTLSYSRWLNTLELPPAWQVVGWCGWLWAAAAGRAVAVHRETLRQPPRRILPPSLFLSGLEQFTAGVVALWLTVVILPKVCFPTTTVRLSSAETASYWTGLALLAAWSVRRLQAGLTWFPLLTLTLAVLAISGTPALLGSSHPLVILTPPMVACVTRLGVELLGVRFGQGYSTEVDTSFGLDFGLPNHPAIVPSRVALDVVMLGCLLGLLAAAAQNWRVVQTLGFGVVVGYGGLCWLTTGVRWMQQAYALAMWTVTYLGVLATACGTGQSDLFTVMPWIVVSAAAVVVGVARPVADEWMLRWALRQVSLGVLVFGALVALTGIVASRGQAGGHGLTLTAAAVAGWVVAWRRQEAPAALAATVCGGLAVLQAARLIGCPTAALSMPGVAYGYGVTWLGWRWRRGTTERAALWSALAIGGQGWLWLAAGGGLAAALLDNSLAAGSGLVCSAVALAVMSLIAADAAAHDVYAVGGLVWGGAAYVWWLRYLGWPAFAWIASVTLPYGLIVGATGWLKQRFQRGSPTLSEALVWLGSLTFCFPVVLQALHRRLTGDVALFYDILADTTALTALLVGLAGRLRAPLTLGGTALGFHLLAVVVLSVPWGDIPYGVYLAVTGLLLFVTGTWLWRRRSAVG